MMKEFCDLTGVTEEAVNAQWSEITKQLFKYVLLENRKSVKKLVEQYNRVESSNEGI